ncbi:FBOX domain-containing protein [Naegleria gruberi]|uniref:FBOX domain-containing protein n=1 Tax=Naegleria gruberi TaxID=5762 RepID=D2VU48_NAEGR|nr:FBOX domain-containing protein [Naegleria gruberi]EFC39626.1 FBOX domain-containing protein [Naegleria gruberi]|eukprot:XP_002672370.1 FBOX domain-containing protein [Naegleria gruberi strain NEG-M]
MSESDSSCSSDSDDYSYEQEKTTKRKYVFKHEYSYYKKSKKEYLGMQTLLGSQPDEIIEQILNFMNYKSSIQASSVSQQFRRAWKQTPHGIVYTMVIQLNYSFKKHSYSLDDKVDCRKFTKEIVLGVMDQYKREKKNLFHLRKADRLISELRKTKKQSENFSNAISKITGFDYERTSKMDYGTLVCKAAGFEIEFGELGMVRFWGWDPYSKYEEGSSYHGISAELKGLELTNEEWDIIIGQASDYIDSCQEFEDFDYYDDMGKSVFTGHELEIP